MRTLMQHSNRCCTASAVSSSAPRGLHAAGHSLCCATTSTAAVAAAASPQGFRKRITSVHQRSATGAPLPATTPATACRKQRCTRIKSTSGHSAEGEALVRDLNPELYLDPSAYPEAFVGPIKAVHIPGRGRGLIATQPLQPGQLLLVTPPLALVEGNLGEIPEHDELQEVIASSGALFTAWQADWLAALISHTDGTGSSSSGGGGGRGGECAGISRDFESVDNIPDMVPPAGDSKWYMQDDPAAAAAAETRLPFESLNMTDDRLWAAIVLNCYGEAFQDLPATLCSGADLSSQLGLWGPFALLNHSCRPNAVNYTLRDSMVVRAAAAVAAGEEVCINYLGRGALRPWSQRQQELELCYGFKCNCPRCVFEAEACTLPTTTEGVSIGKVLDSIMEKLPDYEVQLHAALAGISECSIVEHNAQQDTTEQQQQQQNDTARSTDNVRLLNCTKQLTDLIAEMQQQWQELTAAAERCGSSTIACSSGIAGGTASSDVTTAVAWLEASAFDLLGLLQEAAAAAVVTAPVASSNTANANTNVTRTSGDNSFVQLNEQVLAAMLHVCESVCTGSDLHVLHALRWTSKVQAEQGEDSPAAAAAFARLVQALSLRYGAQVTANEELLQRMVRASSAAAAMVSF